MEKSILIIDTPSECEECPVRGTYGYTGGCGSQRASTLL